MDSKTFGIGVLCVTAVILLVANFIPVQPTAHAADAIKDRDYTVVTAPITSGGEGLYITDNRTGLIAVFTWDAAKRTIVVRDVKPTADAFE